MKRWRFVAFLSFVLFFFGCASTRVQAPLHKRPVGFWTNEEAIVQVLHVFSAPVVSGDGKLALDSKGKITTTLRVNLGTGAVVDVNGLVMTNEHIVNEDCPIVVAPDKLAAPLPKECPLKTALTPDQLAEPIPAELYAVCKVNKLGLRKCGAPAELVAADDTVDLALLRTKERFARAVEFADDSELIVGDEIYFWGNVFGFLPPSPFFGHYIGRMEPPYYEGDNFSTKLPLLLSDINFSPGSSGAPMFNELGKVVGWGNSYTNPLMGGRSLGVSIPSSRIMKFLKENRPKQKK